MEQARFWDRQATSYAKAPIKDIASYEATLNKTRALLRPTDRVLEIGAGTGSTAIALAPYVKHITATDISSAMLAIAERSAREANVHNLDCVVTDAAISNLPGPYDIVLAHNVLHLIEDLPTTIARIHDVLKPGGYFISKTFCKPEQFGPPLYYAMLAALPVMRLVGKAPFVAFRGIGEYEAAIKAEGFTIDAAFNPGKDIRRYVAARKN